RIGGTRARKRCDHGATQRNFFTVTTPPTPDLRTVTLCGERAYPCAAAFEHFNSKNHRMWQKSNPQFFASSTSGVFSAQAPSTRAARAADHVRSARRAPHVNG